MSGAALRDRQGRFHRHGEWRLESSTLVGCHQRVTEETYACGGCGERERRAVKPVCSKCAEMANLRAERAAALEALGAAQKIVDILKPTMNLGVVQVPPPIQDHDRLYALKDAINAYAAILGESE